MDRHINFLPVDIFFDMYGENNLFLHHLQTKVVLFFFVNKKPTPPHHLGYPSYRVIPAEYFRPRFNMMALTLHEAVPGHHTQMSYALRDTLPAFQRAIEYRKYYAVPFNWRFYTAYVEVSEGKLHGRLHRIII